MPNHVIVNLHAHELSATQVAEVSHMFLGDQTCSLQNMSYSCFASERCNRSRPCADGTGPFHPTSLTLLPHAFAAIRTCDGAVVGVAGVDHGRAWSCPHVCTDAGYVLCNLCVHHDARGSGVGTDLIEAAKRAVVDRPLFVTVRLPEPGASRDVQMFMNSRCNNLIDMYQRRGFVPRGASPTLAYLSVSSR